MSHQRGHQVSDADPREFWEERYGAAQVWSGRVNAVLADVAATLPVGNALDLGCGEGGDVIWLAEQGWQALGIDISEAATSRARKAAAERGVSDRARFAEQDLTHLELPEYFDLVTASFLQSPVRLDRAAILRRAAALVRPGGVLLVTSHAAPPPWSEAANHPDFRRVDPTEEVAELQLSPEAWERLIVEVRQRPVTAPDGTPAVLDDAVVLLRRIAE